MGSSNTLESNKKQSLIIQRIKSNKYSVEKSHEIIRTYILDTFNKEPWLTHCTITIIPMDDKKDEFIIHSTIDINHPNIGYKYRKVIMDLDRVLEDKDLISYLPYIEKYGTEFKSKTSEFLIQLYFEPSFQIDLNIRDNPNMEHQLDYIEKVWNNTKFRLMSHQYFSNVLKDIEYTEVKIDFGHAMSRDGMQSYMEYRFIVPIELPVQPDVHDLTLTLAEATKQYFDHAYLAMYTEGSHDHPTELVKTIELKH